MACEVRPSAEAGFTLIEAVVALGVFSLAALSLLSLNAQSARASSVHEEAAYARIVADNQLVLAMIDERSRQIGVDNGTERQAGIDWSWMRTVTPTTDPDLVRIDVTVRLEDDERVAAALTGFGSVR